MALKLSGISVDALLDNLNAALSESEIRIELGDFVNGRLSERTEIKGEYPLIQTGFFGFRGAMGSDSDREVGSITIERKHTELDSDYGGFTEVLKLKLTRPLELADNTTLPLSKIKIVYETSNDFDNNPIQYRTNHQRIFGLWVPSQELTKQIPTEWFYSKGTQIPKSGLHFHMTQDEADWYVSQYNSLRNDESVDDIKNPLVKRRIGKLLDKRASCKECSQIFLRTYDPNGAKGLYKSAQ